MPHSTCAGRCKAQPCWPCSWVQRSWWGSPVSHSEEQVPKPHRRHRRGDGRNSPAGGHVLGPGLRHWLVCSTRTCRQAEFASVVGTPHHVHVSCRARGSSGTDLTLQRSRPCFPSPSFLQDTTNGKSSSMGSCRLLSWVVHFGA